MTTASAPPTPESRHQRRLRLVFGITSVYLVAEVIGGILTRSLALLADAGHMLTDVAGSATAIAAMRMARTEPSRKTRMTGS